MSAPWYENAFSLNRYVGDGGREHRAIARNALVKLGDVVPCRLWLVSGGGGGVLFRGCGWYSVGIRVYELSSVVN